jgi:hypothetical protein
VTKAKHNPVQRIKVSQRTLLGAIANYVQRLAGPDMNYPISLHATYRTETVQLPLSLSIAEFFFFTNQRGQADLRYTFSDRISGANRQSELRQPPKLRGRKNQELQTPNVVMYPSPLHEKASSIPQPVGGVFHSGLSLFSNSFGFLPSSMDGLGAKSDGAKSESEQSTTEDVVSLRKGLEAELGKGL